MKYRLVTPLGIYQDVELPNPVHVGEFLVYEDLHERRRIYALVVKVVHEMSVVTTAAAAEPWTCLHLEEVR